MCYDGPSLYYVDYSEFTIQSQAVIFTAALSLSLSLSFSLSTPIPSQTSVNMPQAN